MILSKIAHLEVFLNSKSKLLKVVEAWRIEHIQNLVKRNELVKR
jgi:hypothetical protein